MNYSDEVKGLIRDIKQTKHLLQQNKAILKHHKDELREREKKINKIQDKLYALTHLLDTIKDR